MDGVIVVPPGGGEAISSGTSVRVVKVDIETLHVTEYTVEKAPMGDLHTHERHSDAFYVLEGELDVAISETETVPLGPGGFATAPPGAVHAFGVPERARFLNIHAPGMGIRRVEVWEFDSGYHRLSRGRVLATGSGSEGRSRPRPHQPVGRARDPETWHGRCVLPG